MEATSEKEYIARTLQGEQAAFAFLVESYKNRVYTLILRIVKQPEIAEELTQDSFIKVFQHLSSFKEQSAFSTWLYRIAYNTAISETRKRKKIHQPLQEHFFVPLEDDSEHVQDEEQKIKVLNNLVNRLPAEESALIMLFYHHDKSMEEISEITGLSIANVKVKIHRTRNKLREQIKQTNSYE